MSSEFIIVWRQPYKYYAYVVAYYLSMCDSLYNNQD